MAVIELRDVWEMYRIKFILDGKVSWENFWALRNIDLDIERGEILGIIGENGAGKSTLLKLMAGMLKADRGSVVVRGKVSGLLELGAGFQAELTGRENVLLSAGLFGLGREEAESRYPAIVDFASLGKFIHAPVKCYSQGMFVRLAFAIAVHMDPDIFLIDDTLAVGDSFFQRKCIQKIFDIKNQGKTIVFVTHDTGLLSRLCTRALLLKEGRVVRDGALDKVISLGMQMIGERRGVGVLERGPASFVFNNGRLFINWREKTLTPNSGAHVVFRINDQWHDSPEAEWEVVAEGAHALVATGRFHRLGLVQTWRLALEDDHAVTWEVDVEAQGCAAIQEGYVNLMLVGDYEGWATTLEKGTFSPIDEGCKNWESMLTGDRFRRCLAVTAPDKMRRELPSLFFEQTNPSLQARAQILNTDFLLASRVLQYRVFENAARFSGKIVVDVPDADDYLRGREEEFALKEGRLKIIFDNGQALFYWDDIPLTKGRHGEAGVFANGKWHFSRTALWAVKKEGNHRMTARGKWSDLPVAQVWNFDLLDESSFSLKVSLEVAQEIILEQQRFEAVFVPYYTHWFSDYGKGAFPKDFLEHMMDMPQRCIPGGAIGLGSPEGRVPALSVTLQESPLNFGKVFNSDFREKARILQLEKIEAESETRLPPGAYPVFGMNWDLGDSASADLGEDHGNVLGKDALRFVFDQGRGRIFWGKSELTKIFGLYTSLRSGGRWHDSASSVLWKSGMKADDTIEAEGKWRYLPLEQRWVISLPEKNILAFHVTLVVSKELEVDRLQANLMVSERYTAWSNARGGGVFPAFKNNVDDDWDVVDSSAQDHAGGASVLNEEGTLPRITFFPLHSEFGGTLNVVNSDVCHRGRVLQHANKSALSLAPGAYDCFQGRIVLEP